MNEQPLEPGWYWFPFSTRIGFRLYRIMAVREGDLLHSATGTHQGRWYNVSPSLEISTSPGKTLAVVDRATGFNESVETIAKPASTLGTVKQRATIRALFRKSTAYRGFHGEVAKR